MTRRRWWRRTAAGDDQPGGPARAALPAHDPQEMLHAWLRALTILGEKRAPAEALELIATVNQPRTVPVQLRTRLPADDEQVLAEVLAWNREVRSRQAGVNMLVDTTLIRWLAEATGQTWSHVVQRLALELHDTLPPGTPPQ